MYGTDVFVEHTLSLFTF